MSNDQYCLRWNSYQSNILATFENLLDSEALSDVTLFCEGECPLPLPEVTQNTVPVVKRKPNPILSWI